MPRIRLALATVGLAVAASAVGVGAIAAPANAGVLGCVASAITLEHDLRVDAGHAVGDDVQQIGTLVGQLVVDVASLNLTAIQSQAETVIFNAANGVIAVSQHTLADAHATLTACQVH